MSFLLSLEGLAYNAPALFVLGLLLWKRPVLGCGLAALAGLRVGAPLLGFPSVVPFSVHAALAACTMVAWTRKDLWGNALLFGIGLGLFLFTYAAVGWLLPDTAAVLDGVRQGAIAGFIIGTIRAVAYAVLYLGQSYFRSALRPEDRET